MSHQLYHTEGIVLGSAYVGEAHRSIHILTREFGFLVAAVRSAREERSKLRYHVQDYSHALFTLVRGRDIWRVTGAQAWGNYYTSITFDQRRVQMCARVVSLLRRLLHGEGRNDYLFDSLLSFLSWLAEADAKDVQLHSAECVTVLRMLHSLGYMAEVQEFHTLLHTTKLDATILQYAVPIHNGVIQEINRSLVESHL